MAAAFAAAQAWQGPLDGGWVLRDARGRALLTLQIAEPPQGGGPLEAAWRAADSPVGIVDTIQLDAAGLTLVFTGRDGPARLQLQRAERGWRGRLRERRGERAVTMERPPPSGR